MRLSPVFFKERRFSEYFFPMKIGASNVEDINFLHFEECLRLVLHLLRIGPASFALDHSPCARMILILTKGLIM